METTCKNCSKPIQRTRAEVRKSKTQNFFCGSSCSQLFNNALRVRVPVFRDCKRCSKPFQRKNWQDRRVWCELCQRSKNNSGAKDLTLAQIHKSKALEGKHPSWRNAYVRNLNRLWNAEMLRNPCFVCGYSTHIELAHKKPISAFSPDTLLKVVNAPENVIALCRNHHWEFDHGLLQI